MSYKPPRKLSAQFLKTSEITGPIPKLVPRGSWHGTLRASTYSLRRKSPKANSTWSPLQERAENRGRAGLLVRAEFQPRVRQASRHDTRAVGDSTRLLWRVQLSGVCVSVFY